MSMPQTPGLTAMDGQLRGRVTNTDAGGAVNGPLADAAWRRGISPVGKGYHAVRWTVNHHNGGWQGLLAQQVGIGGAGRPGADGGGVFRPPAEGRRRASICPSGSPAC